MKTFHDIMKFIDESEGLVRVDQKLDDYLKVVDVAQDSPFYFEFTKIPFDSKKKSNNRYKIAFKPYDNDDPERVYEVVESSNRTVEYFKLWLKNVDQYKAFESEYQYYNDLFEESKSEENEKYDTSFYNTQQQFILLDVLNVVREVLEEENLQDERLIEELSYLENNLQKFNKSETRRRFTDLFSKLKNKSILLLSKIVKKVKEKLEDKLIERGIDAGIIYLIASLT